MTHAFTVGMEVFIDRTQYRPKKPMQLCAVEKVTATQFTAGGYRFKADGNVGLEIGGYDKWNKVICRIATPEMKARNALTIKRRAAEIALSKIGAFIGVLRDDDAVAAFDLLPQSIKDKVQP